MQPEKNGLTCFHCGGQLIWGCDYAFEDYEIDGDGIVHELSCQDCGAFVTYYIKERKQEHD